ncbi:MAG: metallophosphoesterase, partial [Candidatus Sabulitectum sp.]|nr:metallophosphoesterase [Candidatus Sabulitectum sp.]
LFLLLLFVAVSHSEQCVWNGVGRVVAVGDVHGDLGQFVRILQGAGLVDGDLNWIGGKTHLVQVGDVLDRGPDSKAIMNLLMSLELQAPMDGGYVHFLLGNHEVMLMKTDLRYVHQGEILSYGGLKEMVRALRPDGEYGSWLAGHNAAIRINNALFVHAGISEDYASVPVDSINELVRSEIARGWTEPSGILSGSGPVWFRGLAVDRGSAILRVLEETLETNDADFIVIGHTVSIEGIATRFSGRVVMIDTGISECYGGAAQYLELDQRGYKIHFP